MQVIHKNGHWKDMGGPTKYTLPLDREEFSGAGGITFIRNSVKIELRIFKDIELKEPLTEWFDSLAALGDGGESLLSGLETVRTQGLLFATVSGNNTQYTLGRT